MNCSKCRSPLMRDERDAWALAPQSQPTCWNCQDEHGEAGEDDRGIVGVVCAVVLAVTMILGWFAAVIPWAQIARQHGAMQEASR